MRALTILAIVMRPLDMASMASIHPVGIRIRPCFALEIMVALMPSSLRSLVAMPRLVLSQS